MQRQVGSLTPFYISAQNTKCISTKHVLRLDVWCVQVIGQVRVGLAHKGFRDDAQEPEGLVLSKKIT